MSLRVVTANRLGDGAVVYLSGDGDWSEWIAAARVGADDVEAERLMAAAQRAVEEPAVVEPYLIEVAVEGETVRPLRYREVIRATGPTVHPEHGKPAFEG